MQMGGVHWLLALHSSEEHGGVVQQKWGLTVEVQPGVGMGWGLLPRGGLHGEGRPWQGSPAAAAAAAAAGPRSTARLRRGWVTAPCPLPSS